MTLDTSSNTNSNSITGDMDVCLWLTLKLNKEWSSLDVASLITLETLNQIEKSFHRLETPVKVRTMLSFLSMKPEDTETAKYAILRILSIAEVDSDEWVKVGSGLVKRWLFESSFASREGDFFDQKLQETANKVLERVSQSSKAVPMDLDLFSLEYPYLCKELQQHFEIKKDAHFTVVEEQKDEGSVKVKAASGKQFHKPEITRPVLHTVVPPPKSTGNVGMKSYASKRPLESRRSGDVGRFKRARGKISVIDIDEVKLIESQKAEERKRKAEAANDSMVIESAKTETNDREEEIQQHLQDEIPARFGVLPPYWE